MSSKQFRDQMWPQRITSTSACPSYTHPDHTTSHKCWHMAEDVPTSFHVESRLPPIAWSSPFHIHLDLFVASPVTQWKRSLPWPWPSPESRSSLFRGIHSLLTCFFRNFILSLLKNILKFLIIEENKKCFYLTLYSSILRGI